MEFLHPGLVRRDGCAFDSDVVLLDGLGGVDRDLVVGLAKAGNDVSELDAGMPVRGVAQAKPRGLTASRDSSPRS